jgi:septal ring factor EnvC (AmiA/AmiB activator)
MLPAPETLISLGAVAVAIASFLLNLRISGRNARREEMNALRAQHQHELDALRRQHQQCETKLIALETQFEELSKRYLAVLEEAVRRGMNPQIVLHTPFPAAASPSDAHNA